MDAASAGHASAQGVAQATARRVHGVDPDEPPASRYVGLVTRAIAFAIDAAAINVVAITVAGVTALILSLLPDSPNATPALAAIGGAVFALWIVGYFLAFWTTTGQTPGNRLMEIRVMRADGTRLRPRHAIARMFGIVISVPLLLGFLPILVTERRRGLPDWLAGTVVVNVPREKA